MSIQLKRSTLAALVFAIGAAGFTANTAAQAGDACAGQSWPNYSQACKDQMVEKIASTMVVKEKPKSESRKGFMKLKK